MKFCPKCDQEYSDEVEICPQDDSRLLILSDDSKSLIGQKIDDRFTVKKMIGEGGMGTVYLATQEPVGRQIALKVLRRDLAEDNTAVRRFFHEAQIVSKLRHPNTITLFDFGQTEDKLLYIAMEYLEGAALDEAIQDGGFDLKEILEISEQICQALTEAHENGIIHRDLKPENVFIDKVGARNIVKVMDFGIAKIQGLKSNLTLTGMVFGTPAYMSPEQAQGLSLDHRTDVYSLGVLLFELLSGHLPFSGASAMKVAMAHILNPVPDLAEVAIYSTMPTRLVELVASMMAKSPDERPDTVRNVEKALAGVRRELGDSPVTRLTVGHSSTEQPVSDIGTSQTVGEEEASNLAGSSLDSSTDHATQIVGVRERVIEESPAPHGPESTGPQESRELLDTSQIVESGVAIQAAAFQAADQFEVNDTVEVDATFAGSTAKRLKLVLTAAVFVGAAVAALIFLQPPPDDSDDGETIPVEVTPELTVPEIEPGIALVEGGEADASSVGGGDQPHAADLEGTGTSVSPEPAPVDEPIVVSVAVPNDPPELVTVQLVTSPNGARIVRTDTQEVLCQRTPCELELPYSEDPIAVRITRRRRQAISTEILPLDDDTHTWELVSTREETSGATSATSPTENAASTPQDPEPEDNTSALVPLGADPEPEEEPTEDRGLQLMAPVITP